MHSWNVNEKTYRIKDVTMLFHEDNQVGKFESNKEAKLIDDHK